MHLGLYADRFNQFGSFDAPYSCQLVILTIHNFPLEMCMRLEFMFLSSDTRS